MKQRGFTVIELLTAIVLLVGIGVLFFVQKSTLESGTRDEVRRSAINAIHYNLEDVFYRENEFYPRTVTKDTLPGISPEFFVDPNGTTLGEPKSDYRYEPTGCNTDDRCTGYSLRADLENESDFVKQNRDR